jgi:Bacteriocin-protection, YdeI or OmpD-Associated/Domain of unknown function (DUF1905)
VLFRATILTAGKTATGIPVPDDVIASLNAGKRPALSVTINGYTYRTTVGFVDGRTMIPLSAENRAGAGVAGGDEVEIEVELDTAPREVSLPADFAAALERDAAAKRTFEGLSNSLKNYHVQQIEGAKSPETRQRRIEKSIATLHEGKPR